MKSWPCAVKKSGAREVESYFLSVDWKLTLTALRLKLSRWLFRAALQFVLPAAVAAGGILFAMPKQSPVTATPPKGTPRASALREGTPVNELVADPRVKTALDWLAKNSAWVTDQQTRITEIPAPPFKEAGRGAYLKNALAACGLRVHTDDVGNVIGDRPGSSSSEVILLVAHMDTVFPEGTSVHVRKENGMLYAPGIADNGAGLATLLGIARALNEAKMKTRHTLIFAADVGEEGEGNLRGVRKLVEEYRSKLSAVIALDGASTEYVVTQALASRRVEIILTGPGGHSWTDFGTPNPIDALARGIARFVKNTEVPGAPRTTYNIGYIEGGGSVNAIPARAAIKVDIRSENERELGRVESALRDSIRAGIQEEMAASNLRGMSPAIGGSLEMSIHTIGSRPGGELAPNSPLLQSVMDTDRFLDNRSRTERSSTDANIPLSMGIPAISLGGGGRAGGAHTLSEWYDPGGREMGLQRVLLTLLSTAGVDTGGEK